MEEIIINNINDSFTQQSNNFVSTQSENQTNLIMNNTIDVIEEGINKGDNLYQKDLDKLNNNISDIEETINSLAFSSILAGFSDSIRSINLTKRLNRLVLLKERLQVKKNKIIEQEFRKDFLNKSRNRSETISELETGSSSSMARETEAGLIDNQVLGGTLFTTLKNWDATLDSKTRATHTQGDKTYKFNPININSLFQIGNSFLRYARDLNGEVKEIIRCRCENMYTIIRQKINR